MKKFSRPSHTVGHAPGTIAERPASTAGSTQFTLVTYDSLACEERQFDHIDDCLASNVPDRSTWIDIFGLHDTKSLEMLGAHFHLHPLLLEDISNTVQRSKVEQYEGKTYIVVRMLEFCADRDEIESHQISMVLADTTLITLRDAGDTVFKGVRKRLHSGRPKLRGSGIPYLAYSLMDAVVDSYFLVLEQVGAHMEELEETLLDNPTQDTLHAIHRLRRELIYLRKSVWPLREAIGSMLRDEDLPFRDQLHVYLRDLYDHTVQVNETIESYRELNSAMLETYLSAVNNRMNEVMKTLTVIATLFIPLTFLVGVYGMNFDHMPELHWRWSYLAIWGLMITVTLVMLRYFRTRGWF